MQARCFAPIRDTPGKHDATGAFLPEAHRFLEVNGIARKGVHLFDNGLTMSSRREMVQRALLGASDVDVVAWFCHGWRDGFQAGYRLPQAMALAAALKQCARAGSRLTVLLYACDTGRDGDTDRDDDRTPGPGGEGGFADALRDALAAIDQRAVVYAHATEGHCTSNPYVRRFDTDRAGELGGKWVVEPGSAGWRDWVREMRGSDRRFTFWRES